MTDEEYHDIMKEIDEGDFDVDFFESGFLNDVMVQGYPLTSPQKDVILKMKDRYL